MEIKSKKESNPIDLKFSMSVTVEDGKVIKCSVERAARDVVVERVPGDIGSVEITENSTIGAMAYVAIAGNHTCEQYSFCFKDPLGNYW